MSNSSDDQQKNLQSAKPNLTRTATTPTESLSHNEFPRHEFVRQNSASASTSFVTAPVSALTAYLRRVLGMGGVTTRRSLSEEAESGSPDSIAEWLRTGSDPNEKDAYGYTPLVNACMRGCNRSVKTLLANGANVNLKASHGYTPLHTAAQYGFVEIAELLIDAGADLELKNDDGDTPLILAVRSENAPVVDLLCQRGCNIHAHGFDDIDPLEYALNKRNLYLSDVLMKHERQHMNSVSSNTDTTTNDSIVTKSPNTLTPNQQIGSNDSTGVNIDVNLTSSLLKENPTDILAERVEKDRNELEAILSTKNVTIAEVIEEKEEEQPDQPTGVDTIRREDEKETSQEAKNTNVGSTGETDKKSTKNDKDNNEPSQAAVESGPQSESEEATSTNAASDSVFQAD